MTDCFRLPNVAKLVEMLHTVGACVEHGDECVRCNGESKPMCRCEKETALQAAYTIEQLQEETEDQKRRIYKLSRDYNEVENYLNRLMKENVRLKVELDAVVSDLKDCLHYAKPKNNNVCNFCKKDMAEYPDKCAGWSDSCECKPEWRGVPKEKEDVD